jgi:SAM-dependent methyltransferase
VIGIDRSDVMRAHATRRNAAAVRAGRVELRALAVEELSRLPGSFDKILAVNNLAFWADPTERLRELRSRLVDRGRIAIVSQPRCPGATADTTANVAEEIAGLLETAGFGDIEVETLPLDPPVACVLATTVAVRA